MPDSEIYLRLATLEREHAVTIEALSNHTHYCTKREKFLDNLHEKIDDKFDKVGNDIIVLNQDVNKKFNQLMLTIVGACISLMVTILAANYFGA